MAHKKISILVDQFLGNNMYRTFPFLEILNENFELEVLTSSFDKSQVALTTHLSEDIFKKIEIKSFNTFSSIRKRYDYTNFFRIADAIKGELMICYKFLPGMLIPSLLRKLTKRKKLIVDLDDYDVAFRRGIDKNFTLMISKLTKLSNLVFSGSKFLQKKYGGIYLPTPVKIDYFNREQFNSMYMRERYNLQDQFIILYMGTFALHKGIKEIIDIFSLVLQECKNVKLLMVGGAKKERLEELIRNYGVKKCGKNIIFSGFRPHAEMPYFLASSDVFLTPVRDVEIVRAQTPAKIAEAQSMSVPIISSAVGEYKNLIKDESDGFLLEPGNLRAFKDKIIYLMENEQEKIKMGKQARDNCIRYRSYETIQRKINKIFIEYDLF